MKCRWIEGKVGGLAPTSLNGEGLWWLLKAKTQYPRWISFQWSQ